MCTSIIISLASNRDIKISDKIIGPIGHMIWLLWTLGPHAPASAQWCRRTWKVSSSRTDYNIPMLTKHWQLAIAPGMTRYYASLRNCIDQRRTLSHRLDVNRVNVSDHHWSQCSNSHIYIYAYIYIYAFEKEAITHHINILFCVCMWNCLGISSLVESKSLDAWLECVIIIIHTYCGYSVNKTFKMYV